LNQISVLSLSHISLASAKLIRTGVLRPVLSSCAFRRQPAAVFTLFPRAKGMDVADAVKLPIAIQSERAGNDYHLSLYSIGGFAALRAAVAAPPGPYTELRTR